MQGVYRHASSVTGTEMTFSVFVFDGDGPFPVLWYLSGLTCAYADVMEKDEYRSVCAEAGIDLPLSLHPGYYHSYYFISIFMAKHVRWHAQRLKR